MNPSWSFSCLQKQMMLHSDCGFVTVFDMRHSEESSLSLFQQWWLEVKYQAFMIAASYIGGCHVHWTLRWSQSSCACLESQGTLSLLRIFCNNFLVCWLLVRLLQKLWRESVLILGRSCMDWWDFVRWHPYLPYVSSFRTRCQDSGAPWVPSYCFSQPSYQEVL
jgi:hypothetical protein